MGAVFDSLYTEFRDILADPHPGVRYSQNLVNNALNFGIKQIYDEAPLRDKVYFLQRAEYVNIPNNSTEYNLPQDINQIFAVDIYNPSNPGVFYVADVVYGNLNDINFPSIVVYNYKFKVFSPTYPCNVKLSYLPILGEYRYTDTSKDLNLIFATKYKQKIFNYALEFIYKQEATSV